MAQISVIIPVYNTEKYIAKCLQSVISQTFQDIEIICIDDGSTDNSLQILNDFAQKDARIKVIAQPNSGAGPARNAGLKIATGKYLSFLDADDFFEKNMLEVAFNECEKAGAQICVFRNQIYLEESGKFEDMPYSIRSNFLPKFSPFSGRDIAKNAFQIFVGWAWDKLYLREFVQETGLEFQNLRTTNDAFFVFLHTLLAQKIVVIETPLAYHRMMVSSSLSNSREKSWNCCYEAMKEIKSEMQKRGIYEIYEASFKSWAVEFYLWYVVTMKDGEPKNRLTEKIKNEYLAEFGLDEFSKISRFFTCEFFQLKQLKMGKLSKFEEKIFAILLIIKEHGFFGFLKKIFSKILRKNS